MPDFYELNVSELSRRYAIARRNGTKEGFLVANTILVNEPYNVQVNRLQQRLKGKAQMGTVDKFQGQEPPLPFTRSRRAVVMRPRAGLDSCSNQTD